ncbi:MAG: hypothetical protein INR62_02380 [Rhodospirillales bacterium]|nr:hypothetical protein [Acetobacter sp.]
MKEPNLAGDYDERGVRAMQSVLVELGQILGVWRGKFVVVGGAVPWLLLGHARPAHVGTLDIDLGLDPEALGEGEYANLVEALEQKDYERNRTDLRPFQLRRWVKVDEGGPVSVLVDLLMPRGARGDRNAKKLVEGLRVQGADGAEVALAHRVMQRLEGLMPDGRLNEVELPVAVLPALLVMKGYALTGREKKKDPYDVYFSARNYDGGPEALATECAKLLDDPVAREGYERLARKFRFEGDYGPRTVRIFLEESNALGEMTPAQVQTDAFQQVSTLLRAMDLFAT